MNSSLLHILRTQARRLGGALALLLLWSSLMAVTAAPARAVPNVELPMEHHAMAAEQHHHAGHPAVHPASHQTPQLHHTAHHHGDGACCLAGQSCSNACSLSVVTTPAAYANIQMVLWLPFSRPSAQAVTRPLQPPRRPPKA